MKNYGKAKHLVFVMMCVVIFTMMCSAFVFAVEGDGAAAAGGEGVSSEYAIEQGIGYISGKAYNIIKVAGLALGVVFLSYNALKSIFGGEKGMENAKRNFYIIGVSLAIIYLAPLVITEVRDMFGTMSDSAASNIFNPQKGS